MIVCDSTWGIISTVLYRLTGLTGLTGLPAFVLTEEVLEGYTRITIQLPDINKYSYICLLKLVQIELIIIPGNWCVIR